MKLYVNQVSSWAKFAGSAMTPKPDSDCLTFSIMKIRMNGGEGVDHNFEAGFFGKLSSGGIFYRLVPFHVSARDAPATSAPFTQQDSALFDQDNGNSHHGIAILYITTCRAIGAVSLTIIPSVKFR